MTLVEFIGFVVSLLAMIYLTGKNFREQRRQRKQANQLETQKQQESLKKQVIRREKKKVPPPALLKLAPLEEHLLSEKFREKESKEAAYELKRQKQPSRAAAM